MHEQIIIPSPGPNNLWRLSAPDTSGWKKTARPDDPNRYYLASSDNHVNEPIDWFVGRIDEKYVARLPRVVKDEEGNEWLHSEGFTPSLVKPAPGKTDHLQPQEQYENWEVIVPYTSRMDELDKFKVASGRSVDRRLQETALDGIDAEIIFPQKGLLCFATPDAEFASAMCSAWNRWALEEFKDHLDRMSPMALIATGSIDSAIAEVEWAATNGFHGLCLPTKPRFGAPQKGEPSYNDPAYNRLWAAIAETGLPITMHVGTGQDPRAAEGYGGAIINYISGAVVTCIDPVSKLIASGVFERYPTLRLVLVESGCGWIPWLLDSMDHAARAHHMWVRPVLPELPSFYFRRNCACTFFEEKFGLEQAIRYGLEDNLLWSNDYPHLEGSFPHSAKAIERMMEALSSEQREKVLGANLARIFNLNPEKRRS